VKRLLGLGSKGQRAGLGPKRVSLHQMPPLVAPREHTPGQAERAERTQQADTAGARTLHPLAAAAVLGLRLLLLGGVAAVVSRRNRKHKCSAYGARKKAAAAPRTEAAEVEAGVSSVTA
jgi:hypothetical protein